MTVGANPRIQIAFIKMHMRSQQQTFQHEKVLNTKIKHYLICQQIGQGASAQVYLAINEKNEQQVAIKVIPKAYLNSDKKLMQLVKTQIYVLKTCNNENVVKCFDVLQSSMSIFIVMQYCNSLDMQKYIQNKKYLSEDHAVWYLKQILNGFKGLHEIGAMHRDFKLANLMIHDRICKIADLGFAKQMKGNDLTETILGTEITMAPQVLQGRPYGINADIWSLGIVFYHMLCGKYPFKGFNRQDLIKNIKSKIKQIFSIRISNLALDFLQGCLTYDPNHRITWKEIYNHPLLNKKTVELTYGISNTKIFQNNQEFYTSQSIDNREESLNILRNSARKEIIIQEIQELQDKTLQCQSAIRNSIQITQPMKMILRYIISYGTYLNKLVYPVKFLNLEQIQKTIPKLNYIYALFFIYKRAFQETKQLLYVIRKRVNIFKIQLNWQKFIKTSIYQDLANVVQSVFQKVQTAFKKVQAKLRKQQIQDARVLEQLQNTHINSPIFKTLFEQYEMKFAKDLMNVLQFSKQQNFDLAEICEALLYCIDKQGKQKMAPERFDWNRSRRITYKDLRKQLLPKFHLILEI